MLKEIENREDIVKLVDAFYTKVLSDQLIGYIFEEVVQLDWNHHIPTMYDFWETTLLHKPTYKGNPMKVHIDLDKKEKLSPQHFERWLRLFSDTVDELFKGDKADLAKTRALSIATMMQIKIANSTN